MNKTLPVIIENKKLSGELKKISVAHLFIHSIEEYNDLFTIDDENNNNNNTDNNNDNNNNKTLSSISLVSKIVITTNPGIIKQLYSTNICFISSAESEEGMKEIKKLALLNDNIIEFHSNVNDRFMFVDGYTQKQIRCMREKMIDITNSKKFGIDFILYGKPNKISSVASLIKDFKRNNVFTNTTNDNNNNNDNNVNNDINNINTTCTIDINNINTYYLTNEKNSSTSKLLNRFCDAIVDDVECSNTNNNKNNNTNNIENKDRIFRNRLDNGIEHTKYYKVASKNKHEKKKLLSDYARTHEYSNITIVIDMEQIDILNIKIIRDSVYDCMITNNYEEIIHVKKDFIAVGTPNIMKYYCSLYDCYGMYEYDGNYSTYCLSKLYDSILGRTYYSEYYRYMYSVQLYEHIKTYTDMVVTKVCSINTNNADTTNTTNTNIINSKEKPFVLVTYYGIYEQFDYVKVSLEKLGYTVYDFPVKKIISEAKTKFNNNKTNESNESNESNETNDMDTSIHNTLLSKAKEILSLKPVYMLWWSIDIDAVTMTDIVNCNRRTKHLYFNWDEPYNFDLVNAARKSRLLTSAFVTCDETTVNYTNNGALSAHCVYPGFDPCTHYPYWLKYYVWMHVMSVDDYNHEIMNDTYKMRNLITKDMDAMINFINEDFNTREFQYDISFICTNLYENETIYPDQIVNRKYLVETIYENQTKYNYKLGIYGPSKFNDTFPDSYSCFIKYHNTNDAFNLSKINMCTHVIGNKKGYLNERIFLIMASGGLLFVDPIESDVLINGYNCVFIDQNRVIKQIKSILLNYDRYTQIKINAYLTAQKYCWDNWGLTINEKLIELNNKN